MNNFFIKNFSEFNVNDMDQKASNSTSLERFYTDFQNACLDKNFSQMKKLLEMFIETHPDLKDQISKKTKDVFRFYFGSFIETQDRSIDSLSNIEICCNVLGCIQTLENQLGKKQSQSIVPLVDQLIRQCMNEKLLLTSHYVCAIIDLFSPNPGIRIFTIICENILIKPSRVKDPNELIYSLLTNNTSLFEKESTEIDKKIQKFIKLTTNFIRAIHK